MKKSIIISILLFAAAVASYAQSRTSYFVRNSTQSHEFNAAFAPDQGYIGFPGLSGVDLSLGSNLGPSAFLYPLSDGRTGLFLNNEVSADEFLANIRDNNTLGMNLNYRVLEAGWYTGKSSFWTLSFGVKADVDLSMPGELFRFVKKGMYEDPTQYSISNLGVSGQVYGQVALGYSQGLDKWVKGLRIGGKAKFLVGMADIQANVERLDMTLGSDRWTASTAANGHILGGSGLYPKYDENGHVSGFGFDPSSLGVGGYGAAFDLGVAYTISQGTPVDGLRFSLSVTDLGFISYAKDRSVLLASPDGEIVYEGVDGLGPDSDINQAFEGLKDELLGLTAFSSQPVDGNQIQMLTATMYAGLDYTFLNDKMNVGLLYSARFGRFRTENELTVAWNYAPSRGFDIALSYSLLKTHSTLGWLMTVFPKRGIGFFFGSDFTPLNYAALNIEGIKLPVPKKEFVLDVHFGVTISLGGSNSRYESVW